MKKLLLVFIILFIPVSLFAATPKLLFSDMTDGPVTGWEGRTDKGAAVSIYCRNIGSTRGTSYVTIGGVNLTSASDYAEWGATENPIVPLGIQRITFFLNSSMTTGGGYSNTTISVTTPDGTSQTIPFHTRELGSNHIYFIDNVNGDPSNDGLTVATAKRYPYWFREHAIAGDVCYLKGSGTKYTDEDDDSDWYNATHGAILSFGGRSSGTEFNHAQGVEGNSITVSAYPGDLVEMEAIDRDGCYQVIAWIYGRLEYWTFSKFFMNAQVPIHVKDNVIPGSYRGGFNNLRFINLDITSPWHDNTDGSSHGLGVGISLYFGNDSTNMTILGCRILDVCQDYPGQPPAGTDAIRVYNIYVNGYGTCDGFEVGWCDIGNNTTSRGTQFYGHKDSDKLNNLYYHHNYIHDTAAQGVTFSGEGGEVDYSFIDTVYIYNNIVRRTGVWWNSGSVNIQMGGQFGNGRYGGTYYVYNNVFDASEDDPMSTIRLGVEIDHIYLSDNIIIGLPSDRGYYDYYPSETPIPTEKTTASHNLYFGGNDDGIPIWDNSTLDNVDPQFVSSDPSNIADYQLQESSPAKDAGISNIYASVDFINVPRPQGSAFDLGAYEFDENDPPVVCSDFDGDQSACDAEAACTYCSADNTCGTQECCGDSAPQCDDQTSCEGAGWNWCANVCQVDECAGPPPECVNCVYLDGPGQVELN